MKAENIKYIEDDKEYVLLRPNIYIGSIAKNEVDTYLLEHNKFVKKEIKYVPAFLKILDEIISNSVDEAIKTNFKYANKIEVTTDVYGRISISDNGRGLSSEIEETTNLPQSVIAFTKLKAGSNFEKEQVSIGQNGVGASLVNIFSKEFTVETSDGIKKTHLVCKNNLDTFTYNQRKCHQQFTKVEYLPDYERLNLTLDETHLKMIEKRIINLSLTYPKINFKFNNKKISTTLRNYVSLFGDSEAFIFNSDNVDIAILSNQSETEYISFVNGVDTFKHGQHLTVFQRLLTKALKETNKRVFQDININQLLTNCKVIIVVKNFKNPQFSAQIKDELTNAYDEVKKHFDIDFDQLLNVIARNKDFIENLKAYSKALEKIKERKTLEKDEKKLKRQKIVKYLPPISSKLNQCHLYICEGDSALAQLNSVRDRFTSGYPLRGKIINPRTCKIDKILENENLRDLISIMGLKVSDDSIKNFKFKSIRILTDQDFDGNAIAAQLLNLFQCFWSNLLKEGKVFRVLTPLIIARRGNQKKSFYSLEDYYKYQKDYKILEYNKGLASLSREEYEKIITNPQLIKFKSTEKTEGVLELVFGKSNQNERKDWLNQDDV